jgi:hypothetical protein
MFLPVIQIIFGPVKTTESYRINSHIIYFFLLEKILIIPKYFFTLKKLIRLIAHNNNTVSSLMRLSSPKQCFQIRPSG